VPGRPDRGASPAPYSPSAGRPASPGVPGRPDRGASPSSPPPAPHDSKDARVTAAKDLGWGNPPAPVSQPPPAKSVAPGPSQPVPGTPDPPSTSRPPGSGGLTGKESWQRLLALVKERDRRLHAVLVEARFGALESGCLALSFPGKFLWHFEKFQKETGVLEAMAEEALGVPLRLVATLEAAAVDAPSPREEHRSFVHRAESLFSGRVVDDSPV